MEIDHFDPTLSGARRHSYDNLFPAVAHCNNKKSENWPTLSDRRKGIRFLNPCKEHDYDEHIWEDPDTHELVATSPAGRYHIDCLDLNSPTFVDERRTRFQMRYHWRKGNIKGLTGDWDDLAKFLQMTNEIVEAFIPDISPPPKGAELY